MESERILVVDDDEALLQLLMITLKRVDYQVDGASNAQEALEKVRSQPPFSVMLADMMLPDMSGLDMMREARRIDPQLEVIVITAAGTLETAISALRADGAYDYLLKPLESMSYLYRSVERAATARRMRLEREALEAQMQNEAKRLQALIINVGEAILAVDKDGIVTVTNPAAVQLLGRGELVGQKASECLPRPFSTLVTNWQAIGGQYPASSEVQWSNTIQMVSLRPIIEGHGQEGWAMVIRDITHLKEMDDLKTRLLTEAASRIRLPLAQAVNALAELDVLATQDEHVAGIVYRLTRVWQRIQEWSDDLPTLLLLDSGISIRLANVDLIAALKNIQTEQEGEKLQGQGLKLKLEINDSLLLVRADSNLLNRLVNSLINRAITRSKRGDEVRLQAIRHQNQAWITISDNGPAVSDQDLPHLFEKSVVHLDPTPENTGLELALAKAIVDRMGGQIWIGGQGPAGSAITVCLPIVISAQRT
jgi:PAS domain S-box-containing protein